jgi:hypothetical protein
VGSRRARKGWRGLRRAQRQCDKVDECAETRAVGDARGQGFGARIHSEHIVFTERHKHGGGRGSTDRARPAGSQGFESARVRVVDAVHELGVCAQETKGKTARKDAALIE